MPILNFVNRPVALETAHISSIVGLSDKGFLANIYWGKKIPHVEDFLENPCPFSVVNLSEPQILKEEFSAFGTMHFKETALKVTFSDQVRDFRYRLSECQVEDERLELLATDGMLVKRPLLVGEDFVLVGFREKEWAQQLGFSD